MTDVKLIKGLNTEFVPAEWDGDDTSGIRVSGKAVLVLMDACSGVSSGGIHLTEDLIEKMSAGSESGVLVGVSDGAFRIFEDGSPWTGEKPKVGDRVYVEKYAGKQVRGKDGRIYRIMDYSCIGAVFETDAPKKSAKAA